MNSIFAQYKVDRNSVDMDALVNRHVRYIKMHSEDAYVLSQDSTRRDSLFEKLNSQTDKPFSAYSLVPPGGDPSPYLDMLDKELAKAPATFEEHATHISMAIQAAALHMEFKVRLALRDHQDLFIQFLRQSDAKFSQWLQTEFAPKCGIQVKTSIKTGNSPRLPLPTPPSESGSPSSPKALIQAEAEALLETPTRLIGMVFMELSGTAGNNPCRWKVESVNYTEKGYAFSVAFDDSDGLLSADPDELRSFLLNSHVIS